MEDGLLEWLPNATVQLHPHQIRARSAPSIARPSDCNALLDVTTRHQVI